MPTDQVTNTCTCKAEHWQPHADSCPAKQFHPQCIHIPDGSVVISGEVFDHFCGFARQQKAYDEAIEQLRTGHAESERQLRACQDQLGAALEPVKVTTELPRIPPKHLKDGCYARADALEAHLTAAKAEIATLSETNERLKADAERWQFFRDGMDDSEKLHMIANGTDHYDGIMDHQRLMHADEHQSRRLSHEPAEGAATCDWPRGQCCLLTAHKSRPTRPVDNDHVADGCEKFSGK
jgi:hypothetical protein